MRNGLFLVDDIVKVTGYNGRLFRIVTMRYITKYVFGIYYQGNIYKVIDIKNSEFLDDIFEEDLTLHTRKMKDQSTLTYEQIKWQEYEDNLTLFDIFGDERYQDAAVNIYCELIHNRDNE